MTASRLATRLAPESADGEPADTLDEKEPAPADSVSRFVELHDESLKLLDAARTLVTEMRTALDDCRRRRPVVEIPGSRQNGPPPKQTVKSHRGGRVAKKHSRRPWRRPR